MKKTLLSIMLISGILFGTLSAQTGARFGLKAGFNLATQYGIKPADNLYTVSSTARNGFAGGIMIYYPITESVGIQQELMYVMKGSGQDVTITTPVNINTVSEYKMNYFEMPMVLKYKFVNIGSFGIYGNTGIALTLLINGEYNITTTINAGPPPPIVQKESGDMEGLDMFDYSFVYGLGTDFKLLNKDFFLESRMVIGWNTLAMPNATGADPVPLRNQAYTFALGFYF